MKKNINMKSLSHFIAIKLPIVTNCTYYQGPAYIIYIHYYIGIFHLYSAIENKSNKLTIYYGIFRDEIYETCYEIRMYHYYSLTYNFLSNEIVSVHTVIISINI